MYMIDIVKHNSMRTTRLSDLIKRELAVYPLATYIDFTRERHLVNYDSNMEFSYRLFFHDTKLNRKNYFKKDIFCIL